ncbi:MAG: DUF3857 domain-containing transglutaminase family protein [Janthinobacterium lividum]
MLKNYTVEPKDHIYITEIPAWVKVHPLPKYDSDDPYLVNFTSGFVSLLVSKQVNLCEDNKIFFSQTAYKINNRQVLNSLNDIDIDYNPQYTQGINFHYIRIIRNNEIIDALDISRMHIMRREKDLENKIITGLLTCHYVIPGLKVGDIIDYAYSMEVTNPSFEMENYSINVLFDSTKFQTLYTFLDDYRLLWPPKREYFVKNLPNFPLKVIKQGDAISFEIQFKCPTVTVYQENVPSSYIEKNQFFSISSEENWTRIAQLREKYYKVPSQFSDNLNEYIEILNSKNYEPHQLVTEVLDFCANEIIYTSNSELLFSNIPDDPSIVYERRYGDCKDKCFLCISILKSLGIEAYVAVVNTDAFQALDAFAPNPNAFNHVVVCVFLKGENFWLDPTIPYQGKSLKNGFKMPFMQALIFKGEQSELINYECMPLENPEAVIEENFDFTDPAKIIYSISTLYRYNLAQKVRSSYITLGDKESSEHCLSFIQKYYPSAQLYKDLSTKDNYDDNEILMIESYIIENIYEKYQDNNLYARTFFTEIDRFLRPFKDDEGYIRENPLTITFPEHIKCTQNYIFENKIDLPKNFFLENSFFCFRKDVTETATGFKIDFMFMSLKSDVDAKFYNQYTENVNKVIIETYEILPHPTLVEKKVRKGKKLLQNAFYWLLIFTIVSIVRSWIKG